MRNRILAILGVALAVALGACSDDDAGTVVGNGGSGGDAPVTAPPFPAPGAGDQAPGAGEARLLEPTPGLDNPLPSAIESYAEVGGSSLEVRFYAGVADCYGLDRVEVVEESEQVTVTVFVGSRPDADVCIEIAESVRAVVELEAPLAGRTLVDGSTGEPVPVD